MTSNFRKAYYGSLGVQVVEIKPSVESALSGDELDLEKLSKLCLWVRIPHSYRSTVWKVLLGVLPTYKITWEFAEKQRKEQYDDLKKTIAYSFPEKFKNKEIKDEEITPEILIQMMIVYYLSKFPTKIIKISDYNVNKSYLAMAKAFLEICDNNTIDAFWNITFFFRSLAIAQEDMSWILEEETVQQPTLISDVISLDKLIHTREPSLWRHFQKLNVQLDNILAKWSESCYAHILPNHCLERIWDIMIGGSQNILIYIALGIIISCKNELKKISSANEVEGVLNKQMNYIDFDAVTTKAIYLWERSHPEFVSNQPI